MMAKLSSKSNYFVSQGDFGFTIRLPESTAGSLPAKMVSV